MQMNPIVVDSLMYGVTAALRVVALNAATGREVWRFGDSLKVWHSTSRGVSYWERGNDKRIIFSRGSDLYALDALTGKPIPDFGQQGKIDLRSGLPESARESFVVSNYAGNRVWRFDHHAAAVIRGYRGPSRGYYGLQCNYRRGCLGLQDHP